MTAAKLQPGARAVFIGLDRPRKGTITAIGFLEDDFLGDQTTVTMQLTDGTEDTFLLSRLLVPAKAYRARSWDGWTVYPYEWTR